MRKVWSLLSIVCLLGALGCDTYALLAFLKKVNLSSGAGFGLHLVAIALAWVAFFLTMPLSYRKQLLTSTALIIGFLLPLPIIGLLAILGFRLLFLIRPSQDASKSYMLGSRQYLTLQRFDDPTSGRTQRSILDILGGRDNELRRTAIMALRAVEAKKSLPVLVKAIADSDEQVRLLAQMQFNKIIANLELTIKKMEAEISTSAPPAGKLVELAEQYHELVYLGLSSDETEQLYLNRAIELLDRAIQVEPDNKSTKFFLLKCLVKRGETARAEQLIEELIAQGFQADFLRIWEADIDFQRRDWPALEKALQMMRASKNTDPRLGGLIEFWLGTGGNQSHALR